MRNLLAVILAVALTTVLTACPRHSLKHHHAGPPPHAMGKGPPPHAKAKGHAKHHRKVVVIPKGHHHSAHCGHYHHGGKWYHHHGHVHKHGCGHVLRGKIWVIVD